VASAPFRSLRGLTDVDAITLSLIDLHRSGMEGSVAVTGITLAAITNTLVKGGIAAVAGGRALGLRVGASLLVVLFSGGAALSPNPRGLSGRAPRVASKSKPS
jgi:uncharacterized membrane protein (DUF4010 family)